MTWFECVLLVYFAAVEPVREACVERVVCWEIGQPVRYKTVLSLLPRTAFVYVTEILAGTQAEYDSHCRVVNIDISI
jgi:hypothetical protein